MLRRCPQVLVWSAYLEDDYGIGVEREKRPPKTQIAIYDPNPDVNTIRHFEIAKTKHDMFCPGISILSNGDILVTGGNTAEKTSIFDGTTAQWRPAPDMNIARGYQASTILSTGEVCLWLCDRSIAAHFGGSLQQLLECWTVT
jgi:galactose oxidase